MNRPRRSAPPCRPEVGVPRRPRAFAQSAVRGFDRLSAVDAGRTRFPGLRDLKADLPCRRYAVSTASRRSMPVGDRRSRRASTQFGGTRFPGLRDLKADVPCLRGRDASPETDVSCPVTLC